MECYVKKLKSILILTLVLYCGTQVLAQDSSGNSYLDSLEWKEVIDGRDYTEKSRDGEFDPMIPEFENDVFLMMVKIIGISIIVALLIFLIVRLFISQKNTSTHGTTLSIEEMEQLEDDLDKADLDGALNRAMKTKDYRAAIRILYLILLRDMQAKEWIEFRKDKTDMEYVMEMKGRQEQTPFLRLTRDFEYAWYGDEMLDETRALRTISRFQEFTRWINGNG